ncbi:amidohydrolase [bacterium]|nr:MAG: amidohydrolase [bacterium]
MSARRAFVNGRIYARDPATGAYHRRREMVVEDGRILALGEGLCGAGVECVDLAGATVLPAFADSHVHLTDTGWFLGARSLSDVSSYAQFEARVRALPDSQNVFAGQYDDARWSDGREADARPLEAAFPERLALLVRVDAHSCIVNRQTLAWLDLAPETEGIERTASGTPTGRLLLDANWRAQTAFMAALPERERRAAEGRALGEALRQGALHLHVQLVGLTGREGFEAELRALAALARELAPELAAKIHWKLCTTDVSIAAGLGLPYVGGDVFLDGSIGSRTAAVGRPYLDGSGQGKLFYTDAEVAAYVRAAEERGISAGVHAIGDRALEQAIDAVDAALGGHRSPRTRHFIEHAEMLTDAQIERCARLGIQLSMQPQFDALWGGRGGMYERRLGPERARAMNRLATLLRAGVVVAGGDDSPVCRLAPLEGMQACLAHHEAGQRLTPEQALTLYTYNAARLGFAEGRTGALAPGLAADFVVLDRDPLAQGSFATAHVLQTWGDGRLLSSIT